MKKLLGSVIVLTGLFVGSYYVTGVLTEKAVNKDIKIANMNQNGFEVSLKAYHRGFLKSQADLALVYHQPATTGIDDQGKEIAMPAKDLTIDLPIAITHGPVIVANKSVKLGVGLATAHIGLPQEVLNQWAQNFSDKSVKPEFDLSLFINFINQSFLELSLPAFKLISQDETSTFDWKGLSLIVNTASNYDRYEGALDLKGVAVVSPAGQGEVGPMDLSYDLHRVAEGLVLGEVKLNLADIVILNDKQKVFELKKLKLSSESDIQDELFGSRFEGSIESFMKHGESYGPGALKFSIQNIDSSILASINRQANKLQNGSDADKESALFALMPELPKLFTKGASFTVEEFYLQVPAGKLDAHLNINLPKGQLDNPFQVIHKVKGEGALAMPVGFLQKLAQESAAQMIENANAASNVKASAGELASKPVAVTPETTDAAANKMIQSMLTSGLIVQQDETYVVNIKLQDGHFTVNDKPFSSAMINF